MLINVDVSRRLVEKDLFIYSGMAVEGNGFVGLRSQLRAGRSNKPSHIGCFTSSYIGSYSQLNDGDFINSYIGNYSSIAENVRVFEPHNSSGLTNSFGLSMQNSPIFKDFLGVDSASELPKTYIGSDVWIGSAVQIQAGVIIGHGAVIGAGTCVLQHVPPYAVVVGDVPRIVKWRFPQETVQRLLNSQWFEYDWRNLMVHWAKLEQGLSDMEQLLKTTDVPKLGDGYKFSFANNVFGFNQAQWSFSGQLEQDFGTSDMLEIFARPEIKAQTLQFVE